MKTFTIVSSREQKKYVIETEATTMAELTAAMDAAGIDYSGMTLYEGLTKAEYDPTKGDAILPHDVPYKGETTNDLVFMLTAPQKKIKSGMGYAEMKSYIKDNGLADAFAAKYGKNYTQGKTSEFAEFIAAHQNADEPAKEETATVEETLAPANETPKTVVAVDVKLREAFKKLLDTIEDGDYLYADDKEEILAILDEDNTPTSAKETIGKKSPYSDDAIDDMFADM